MPTELRGPESRLSWRQTVRLFVLLGRVRWLDWRLAAAHRRVGRLGLDAAGDDLLRLARLWLDTHDAIADLLGAPAPPHVEEVRQTLQAPTSQRARDS